MNVETTWHYTSPLIFYENFGHSTFVEQTADAGSNHTVPETTRR